MTTSSPQPIHSFLVPVMGTGFSVDTPIKVAKYGIHSVISLVDDTLIEQMREFYCRKTGEPYVAISKKEPDWRARRITAYLDLVDRLVKESFARVRSAPFAEGSEITKYFTLLADGSPLREQYEAMIREGDPQRKTRLQDDLRQAMRPGRIDVNIMTKIDRDNYDPEDGSLLPEEYADALAALRGFAKSTLESAVVFSAGFNRRLYAYVEKFEDFLANSAGKMKKKIILKVSDFRSAWIQGQFFAKKGLWVSEYRVESGLNCGGHAFASEGYLMGPILEEFKRKRDTLVKNLSEIYHQAVKGKGWNASPQPLEVKVTAQGGVGTSQEHQFLLDEYDCDAVGWGSPLLLVPEATNVDDATRQKLAAGKEGDFYLSDVSPLGVPFNNLRGSASDEEKTRRAQAGQPGSPCPKGHLASNTEFTDRPICAASRKYQHLKIEALKKMNLAADALKIRIDEVVRKACICHDLGEGVLLQNGMEPERPAKFPAVCPGPNLAYFTRIVSLKEMADHIYGRINLIEDRLRPHMFIKELEMYVDYLSGEIRRARCDPQDKRKKYCVAFVKNLLEGIAYYRELFPRMSEGTVKYRDRALQHLADFQARIEAFVAANRHLFDDAALTKTLS